MKNYRIKQMKNECSVIVYSYMKVYICGSKKLMKLNYEK